MLFFLPKYYFQFRVLYTRFANFLLKKTIEDTVRIRHLTIFKKLFIDQRNVYVLGIAKEYEIEGRYNWCGPPYHMIIHALQTVLLMY